MDFKIGDTVRWKADKFPDDDRSIEELQTPWVISDIYIESGLVIICDKDKSNLASILLLEVQEDITIEKIK